MSPQSIKHAITEGFELAKRSYAVFLIYYLFSVLIYAHIVEYKEHLQYALFYLPFYLAFVFSVPSILDKIRKDALTGRQLLKDILSSFLRLIIPLSVFVLLFVAPIVYLYNNNPGVLRNVILDVQKQQTDLTVKDYLTSAFILTLFSFTTFFFALEKRNIISSAFRSVSALLRKPIYFLLLVGISFVQILSRNLIEFDTIYGNILFAIPTAYLNVLIASVNLIYFQDTVQKPGESSGLSKIPFVRWLQTSSPSRNMLIALFALVIFYVLFYTGPGTVPPSM